MKNLDKFFSRKTNTAGKIIRSFRKNFKITQAELCHATGINEKYLSAIENDKRPIGLPTASKIAVFFNFDPSFLLFPSGVGKLSALYPEVQKRAQKILAQKKKAG